MQISQIGFKLCCAKLLQSCQTLSSPVVYGLPWSSVHGTCIFDPWVGNSNPFQYSRLENPMNRVSLAGYSPWVGHKRVGHDLVTKQQYC